MTLSTAKKVIFENNAMESFRDSSATDALVYVQGQSEATGQGNLIAPDYAKRPIFEKAGPNERVTISFERRK